MRPEELHAHIRDYNWDDGVAAVAALLDDRAVDRATALLCRRR